MQYMGSKNKIAKHLLPILLKERDNNTWVEPFVGGGNMIDKVTGKRIGNDNNKYLIALLKAVRDGWTPPTVISKETYYSIRANPDRYDNKLVGFVGFLCSFGAKWMGTYATNAKGVNYAEHGSRMLVKQSEKLKGVLFLCKDYRELDIPSNSFIYCDPPYKGTEGYKDKFNHDIFWEWCRIKTKEGYHVFISEYNAPDDFTCLLEIPHKTTLNKDSVSPRLEKLFKFNYGQK